MKRRLKEPFGKAGLIVGVIALVFAMLGGAYAATSSGGPKATASAKAKQGKQGKPGKQGPPGATGPAGPAGPKGDAGAAGSNGSPGSPGAAGKSVVIATTSAGCAGSNPAGGTTVEVEGSGTKKTVCNGKEGSPWTVGGTLPSGASETGIWALSELPAEGGSGAALIPISFSIPLAAPIGEDDAHVFEGTNIPVGCSGVVGATERVSQLRADPGNFCAWVAGDTEEVTAAELLPYNIESEELGAGYAGLVLFSQNVSAKTKAAGTWAVTAP